MPGRLRIGTSGFSFRDWIGTVYPQGARPADLLSHYARWFDIVEINTTYYRIPPPEMFERMLAKVPEAFGFVVKTPREMTHERDGFASSTGAFAGALRPLVEAGRLEGLLAQFPYSFRPDEEAWLHLRRIAGVLGEHARVFVEFRHADWYAPESFASLAELNLGLVNVDLPHLRDLPEPTEIATSEIAYVRLHGRNEPMWWNHPSPGHRYDYLYSTEELAPWKKRIERLRASAKTCFVFANNCHLGQSVVNALQLAGHFGLPDPLPPPGTSLSLFAPTRDEQIDEFTSRIAAARDEETESPRSDPEHVGGAD